MSPLYSVPFFEKALYIKKDIIQILALLKLLVYLMSRDII